MRKIYVLIIVFVSSLFMSQSWQNDSYNNPFGNSSRKPYDDLARKKEREINRDMENIRQIINRSESIFDQIKENQEKEIRKNSFGPGAPGEPVPIDEDLFLLFSALIIILFFNRKRILT